MSQTTTRTECRECSRAFTVEFSATTSAFDATTRFCPRCGAKL